MQILQPAERQVRVGDRVRARRQRWVVSSLEGFDGCAVLTLTGVEAGNSGVARQVIVPFDRVEPIERPRRLRLVRPPAWRRACRSLIAGDGSSGVLHAAVSARMDLMPHQLEPALAVTRGLGSRLLIADAVGLGKTVEAGLVLAELLARNAATRVLVLTPAGLREQWIGELADRFDRQFTLLDAVSGRRLQRTLPAGVNPWSTEALVVSSVDYVKRPDVLPAVLGCRWDVVVVDEAHGAVSDSERHRAVDALCRRAPHVLLLTATPHNGDPGSFSSLCGTGGHGDGLLVFRRSRADVGLDSERRVHQLLVHPSADERHMHTCLRQFAEAVEREHTGEGASLALATLRKRALSSARSLEQSVERRLAQLETSPGSSPWQPSLLLWGADGEVDNADAAPDWAIPVLSDARQERRLLSRLAEAARRSALGESKLAALRRLLRRLREPVVVFTEYRDTLMHLRESLGPGAAVLHGGLSRAERQAALAQFDRGTVLLATDAAGEGLNLHHRSRVVINLELPWNPMRLEQRIGRVDRIGQKRRVHAFHLIAAGTGEVMMRDRLSARVSRARAEIGAADPLGEDTTGFDYEARTPLLRLEHEASQEAARIRRARELASYGLDPVAGGPYLCFARRRRRRLRLALRGRTLVLFRAELLEWTGRMVATHLTNVLCSIGRGAGLADLDAMASLIEDPGLDAWLAESRRLHAAFWRTRVAREQAIANMIAGRTVAPTQPGLFDRRADRASAAAAAAKQHAVDQARMSIAAARRLESLDFAPPTTVLVLIP